MIVSLALKNLARRPLRTGLTVGGLAASVALLVCLLSFGEGYQNNLHREIDRMGMQMMLVPLGCPYDAAARVLKGRTLDTSLPSTALDAARRDPAVAVAAPTSMAALPRPSEGRTDLWVGIDEAARTLKPWWKLTAGSHWFPDANSVILGSEAAATELRHPGDKFYSPETGQAFTVCGVLERSGTSDDSQFFVPLATAQAMFHQPGRLTAISIRLKDPALIGDAAERLQQVPGAQVVTLTEMMGTFLNLTGAAQSLTLAIALVAVAISGLTIFNTMTAATLERTQEMAVLRAVGLPQSLLFGLMATEAIILTLTGGIIGLLLAGLLGQAAFVAVAPFMPLAPASGLAAVTATAAVRGLSLMLLVGLLAGLSPAWQAARLSPAAAFRAE